MSIPRVCLMQFLCLFYQGRNANWSTGRANLHVFHLLGTYLGCNLFNDDGTTHPIRYSIIHMEIEVYLFVYLVVKVSLDCTLGRAASPASPVYRLLEYCINSFNISKFSLPVGHVNP